METNILQSMLKRNAVAIHRQEMNKRNLELSYRFYKTIPEKECFLNIIIDKIECQRKDIKKLVAIQRAIKAEIKLNASNARYDTFVKNVDRWIKENNYAG